VKLKGPREVFGLKFNLTWVL